jgi:hypothetical protein
VVIVARAKVVSGGLPGGTGSANATLEVWPAGHYRGDLGEARLNQRAALYAESVLEKSTRPGAPVPGVLRKSFDGPDGPVELEFVFLTAGE